ncbi:hypothetical protein BpHYR1_031121, partial [Brachionus plicatilis]
MLVFHVKDVKTGFVEIVFQRVSNKIIHFIVQTPFFYYSDMSLTWTLNFSGFGVNVEATKVGWLFLIRAQNCSKAVPIGFFKVKFVLCLYVHCKVFHREACPNQIVITCHVIVVKNFEV